RSFCPHNPVSITRHVDAWFTGLVGRNELVADGIAHRVEKAPAAMNVAPALIGHALRIGTNEEKYLEFITADLGDIPGTFDMRLARIAKFELGPGFQAVGTMDPKHCLVLGRIWGLIAAVSGARALGVPAGSIINKCVSSSARGRCSTPLGTT